MLIVIAAGASTLCPMAPATEAITPEDTPAAENALAAESMPPLRSSPVGLVVTGASAGITTDYFEQAVTDAIVTSGIFSGVDNTATDDEIEMDMIRFRGAFPGIANDSSAPYLLDIRVIKIEAPSFSIWMTVSMRVLWTLYRTTGETGAAGKTALLRESISSTYTGGAFEGGVHGANRVRVAVEGATRENIRIGIEMLESFDLEQE
jgi:hypothetical protein